MLSLSVVVILLLAVIGIAVRAGFSWRSLWLSVAVLEVLGLGLLGLPGAAFLETFQPVMRRVGRPPISADGAWPAAIAMSLAWPVALLPAYLVARSLGPGNGQRATAALAVLVIACALLGALIYGMGTR